MSELRAALETVSSTPRSCRTRTFWSGPEGYLAIIIRIGFPDFDIGDNASDMIWALNENWALFAGMFMLIVANGLLVTLSGHSRCLHWPVGDGYRVDGGGLSAGSET